MRTARKIAASGGNDAKFRGQVTIIGPAMSAENSANTRNSSPGLRISTQRQFGASDDICA